MSKKLNSLSAIFAVIGFLATSAMAQVVSERKAPVGPKSAVIAVNRNGRLQLAGDKEKVIGAMQKALNSGPEPGTISDVSIQSFPSASYLAVRIEKQGTLYLQLEPSGGGIQNIFYVGEAKYLYCSSEGCGLCTLNMAGSGGTSGPVCNCNGVTPVGGAANGCKLKPRLYVNKLVAQLNVELLAIGFQEAETGTSSSEGPNSTKEVKPGRVDPIKRPNN